MSDYIFSAIMAAIFLPATLVIFAWSFGWNWTKALMCLALTMVVGYIGAILVQITTGC